ncbi:Nucleic acid-binding protein [Corchorus olitorius]|uniref:Nucleic acid-binding protein n=1 Tax=Corchorus olitorius TaxID=93759 RepID=A0A1R3KUG7_9ROSI|nr:Nucleic acid-binding protein [Corchorus olitorius]
MEQLTIGQLYPSRLRQTIRLRVARFWDCIVPGTGSFQGIAFIGTDCNGDGIHVQIPPTDAENFRPVLVEGMVYDITGFRVGAPTANNIAAPTCYVLFLSRTTILQPTAVDIATYPRHFFDFTIENHLIYLANRDKFLADTIGMLIQVTAVAAIHLPGGTVSRRRDFFIMTMYNRFLKITLGENTYSRLDIEALTTMNPKPVMIFAGMVVRTFNGGPYLMSCSASKIYVNLDIPEVGLVRLMYQQMEGPIEIAPRTPEIASQ